jgi:hypothetical protein
MIAETCRSFDGGFFLVAAAFGVKLGAAVAAMALFAVLGGTIAWWTFGWPTTTWLQKARRFAMRFALPVGWTVAGWTWLHQYQAEEPDE